MFADRKSECSDFLQSHGYLTAPRLLDDLRLDLLLNHGSYRCQYDLSRGWDLHSFRFFESHSGLGSYLDGLRKTPRNVHQMQSVRLRNELLFGVKIDHVTYKQDPLDKELYNCFKRSPVSSSKRR